MLFCLLRLHCVFIKIEYLDVGSGKYFLAANQSAIILILKILVYGVMGCCVCYNGLFWERFWLRDCVDCLLWLFFVWFYDWLIRWFFVFVCYVLFWAYYWLSGCVDCLSWLIVPVGCFLLNGCDFERKKKNLGLSVHCNAAVVKPCVKMSVIWFKRLNFWFWWILFVVKTFSCSERRFASGTG